MGAAILKTKNDIASENGFHLSLGGGVANVLAHKVVPSSDYDMPLSAVAHALQDLPHAQSNGGLTRAGGTREAHVQGRNSRVEAELAAHLYGRTDHHETEHKNYRRHRAYTDNTQRIPDRYIQPHGVPIVDVFAVLRAFSGNHNIKIHWVIPRFSKMFSL